jgi:hypothetical protein
MKNASIVIWMLVGVLPAVAESVATSATVGQQVMAVEFARKTIYHSPQTPGYTCWTGAWVMPDGSLMVCFTQATGPVGNRPRGPKEVLHQLTWPPNGDARYDMTGLDMQNVHLRSTDGGATWTKVSADPFRSPMNGVTGECETALGDGTVIRGVWGFYLPYNPELPQTGFLQRSRDGTKTWGSPEVLLDPAKYSVWPKRIRQLRDGRVIMIGGLAQVPANSIPRGEYSGRLEPLLLVSEDDGKTWTGPLPVVPPEHRTNWGGEECDMAELPDGDLLCVFRRIDPQDRRREVRWQGVLKKKDKAWVPEQFAPAPFPHSGHPELLATREGVVLHVATSGVHWTRDAGRSWHPLNVGPTCYYPRSIQASDGRIHIFAHVGSDDPYGAVDQSIVMDSFRLEVQ